MALTPDIGVAFELFPLANYVAALDGGGVQHVEITGAQVPLPLTVNQVDIVLQRVILPDTAELVAKVRVRISLDGGVSWSQTPNGEQVWLHGKFPIAFNIAGGVSLDPFGAVYDKSQITCLPVPQPNNPLRMIQAQLVPLQNLRCRVGVTCRVV